MRKSKIACIAAIFVIVLVVIGLAATRNNRTDKVRAGDRADAAAVAVVVAVAARADADHSFT